MIVRQVWHRVGFAIGYRTREPGNPLGRIAASLSKLPTLPRYLVALGLGLLAAASMPPFNFLPVLVPSLSGLILLNASAQTMRRMFWDGWWWGMGFFVPSLYWIAISMFVDIAQFWWLVPFSVLGLPAVLSVFIGGATLLTRLTSRPGHWGGIVVFAGWWAVGEWLRGHVFTGFPGVLIGYTWSSDNPVLLAGLQTTSVVGIYGLSFLTVLICGLPAWLDRELPPKQRFLPVASGGALLIGVLIWGHARLGEPAGNVPGVTIRIVSTDFPHRAQTTQADAVADFRTLRALAASPGLDHVSAEVWPEAVVDTALNLNEGARQAVAAVAPPNGIVITGTFHVEGEGDAERSWNSIAVVDDSGSIRGLYDKHHLVPFGEYVPLRWLLPIERIASARFDISPGTGPATLPLPGLPSVAPIICYEAIFPGEIIDPAHRPGWIVNVSDDGWFGRGIGPHQQFAIARVRAVEEGLPLIRSANGGISGAIDPYGRRIASLAIGTSGIIDVALPQQIVSHTFYEKFVVRMPYIVWALALMTSIVIVNKHEKAD